MSTVQRLAIVTVAATYLLIVMGAVVRVTGSGLGCPDWPLCHGRLLPPLEFAPLMEYTHRVLGAVASTLLLATVVAAWWKRRAHRSVLLAASAIPALLALQIPLGAVVVWLELPPMVVLVHLTIAFLILGLVTWVAVASGPPPRLVAGRPSGRFHRLAWTTVGAVLVLLVSGAYVRASGASWACAGFPDCNGQALPFGANGLVDIHLVHRLLAYGVAALIGWTLYQAWRTQAHAPAILAAASVLGMAVVAQIAIGATAVTSGVPPELRGLHVAGAAAVWLSAVLLASLAQRSLVSEPPRAEPSGWSPPAGGGRRGVAETLQAYLSLTKPRIVVLLLVTTLASMLLAARGLPPLSLVLFTLLGGALSAGAANALNCYLDRDIDRLMARTMARPLPLGILAPAQALRFALALTVLSFAILALLVNLLAAALSLFALLFYVLVYTRWLKRTSPSNIVIGGVAGAMPPMVGWAAVTGEVSLLAFFLFAIIFWWTPPHFWALALLTRQDYARAGVPMLPVVKGESETRRQILLYTLQLVALTLVMVPLQLVGLVYLAVAAVLGGLFIYYAARLLLEATTPAARRVFRYSLAYLPLLFVAIIVDQLI